MLLTGAFSRSIDEKLRVAVPKRLREALDSECRQAIYIAPGTDQSLALYTEEALSRLADRLAEASPTRQDVRTFNRLFYARRSGRNWTRKDACEFPPELAELARLGKEVVLLGVQDHVEIWPADRWQSYLAERQSHYDEIAEAAFR